MDIELNKISIRSLEKKYKDNKEEGVVGYGGKLDIRPPYQREFVYGEQKREAVLHSLINNFPLNTIYNLYFIETFGTLSASWPHKVSKSIMFPVKRECGLARSQNLIKTVEFNSFTPPLRRTCRMGNEEMKK